MQLYFPISFSHVVFRFVMSDGRTIISPEFLTNQLRFHGTEHFENRKLYEILKLATFEINKINEFPSSSRIYRLRHSGCPTPNFSKSGNSFRPIDFSHCFFSHVAFDSSCQIAKRLRNTGASSEQVWCHRTENFENRKVDEKLST